jgi:N-acetyl-anhydromuramyl-L-alanine amidase AmpD
MFCLLSLFSCSAGMEKDFAVWTDGYALPADKEIELGGENSVYNVYRPGVTFEDALLLPVEQNTYARVENISHIMIHFMSAIICHPDDPFNIPYIQENFYQSGASVHYVIGRNGTIYRMVNESYVAWHAGKGSWEGKESYTNRMNHYAVGIELLGIGSQRDMSIMMSGEYYESIDPSYIGFTEEQYVSLAALVEDICARHDIPKDRSHVLGHQDYTSRKTDPGELFDWTKIGLPPNAPEVDEP